MIHCGRKITVWNSHQCIALHSDESRMNTIWCRTVMWKGPALYVQDHQFRWADELLYSAVTIIPKFSPRKAPYRVQPEKQFTQCQCFSLPNLTGPFWWPHLPDFPYFDTHRLSTGKSRKLAEMREFIPCLWVCECPCKQGEIGREVLTALYSYVHIHMCTGFLGKGEGGNGTPWLHCHCYLDAWSQTWAALTPIHQGMSDTQDHWCSPENLQAVVW